MRRSREFRRLQERRHARRYDEGSDDEKGGHKRFGHKDGGSRARVSDSADSREDRGGVGLDAGEGVR